MRTGASLLLVYVLIVLLVYLIGFILQLPTSLSLFIAFIIGFVVVLATPKQASKPSDTAVYGVLAFVASFLLLSSIVWAIVAYRGA